MSYPKGVLVAVKEESNMLRTRTHNQEIINAHAKKMGWRQCIPAMTREGRRLRSQH